ncbi:MAG: SUMF1/EgtB/PvdO family nonheme iron enzyme [Planctomycetes bacterium]|nr:SUMF1/EgtB/PvdO family nonheme iron enzyme [Planctomycetota bacterium]
MSTAEFHLHVLPGSGPGSFRARLDAVVDEWEQRTTRELTSPDAPHEFTPTAAQLRAARQLRDHPEHLLVAGDARDSLAALRDWLWHTAVPPSLRELLAGALPAGSHCRLVLVVHAEAALLPWECLADATPVVAERFREGAIELLRRPPAGAGGADAAAGAVPLRRTPVRRHALVLIGSTLQEPGVASREDEIAATIATLRAADFEVIVVSGSPRIRGRRLPTSGDAIVIDEVLHHDALHPDAAVERICALIEEHRPALLHFVGRSCAVRDRDRAQLDHFDLFGAHALSCDVGEFQCELPVARLAGALRRGHTRAVVLQSCDLREQVAFELIARGGAEHVVTFGAFLAPAHAGAWAQAFYAALGNAAAPQRSLAQALRAGRAGLTRVAPGLGWLPQHWASPDAALAFADADQEAIEIYCDKLRNRLDHFDARFAFRRWRFDGRLRDVYVELGVREGQSRVELDERDRRPGFDGEPTFAHLVDLHTKRILLGGDPGAGKTTTLRMYAHDLAADALRSRVPVFVSLGRWLQPKPADRDAAHLEPRKLPDFVIDDLVADRDAAFRERLKSVLARLGAEGRLVVLLDGLDELGRAARDALDRQLQDGLFPRCKTVVSTRRYQHTGSLHRFFDAELQPLTPVRAAALLRNLLERHPVTKPQVDVLVPRWRDRFAKGSRTWVELGRVPLFVTLVAELLMAGREPAAGRAAFFDDVFEHLCLDQHRGESAVDPREWEAGAAPLIVPDPALKGSQQKRDTRRRVAAVLDVLASLALAMTERTTTVATRGELVGWLEAGGPGVEQALEATGLCCDAADFLARVARHTGLLAPGDGADPDRHDADDTEWRFWHRSFQEALTAWELERLASAGSSVDEVLARVRFAPSEAQVEAQRVELLRGWEQDVERSWDDHREAETLATADELQELFRHLDRAAGRWDRDGRRSNIARILAPHRARRALQDYWIEPTALLAARLREDSARSWREAPGHSAVVTAGVAELVRGFLARDRELGRRTVERLEAIPADLLGAALAATTWSDEALRDAADGRGLWLGMTTRLAERASLYVAAARAPADLAELAGLLAERAAGVDDPGELFVIARAIESLPEGQQRQAAERAVELRLAAHVPDAPAWRAHFVSIAGGRFRCGSEAGEPRERPVHDVELSPFRLGGTPVTVRLFRRFWPGHRMSVDGRSIVTLESWRGTIDGEPVDELPVSYVSWYAAQMLCRWLRHHWEAIAGDEAELSGLVPVLPTEAQAEFAIRGGPGGIGDWWFGEERRARDCTWNADNSEGRSHAVGRKERNGLGLADVVGNVWWWCRDAFDPRAYELRVKEEPVRDPVASGPAAAPRVVRGGSFVVPVHDLRSASRDWFRPATRTGTWACASRSCLRPPSSARTSNIDLRDMSPRGGAAAFRRSAAVLAVLPAGRRAVLPADRDFAICHRRSASAVRTAVSRRTAASRVHISAGARRPAAHPAVAAAQDRRSAADPPCNERREPSRPPGIPGGAPEEVASAPRLDAHGDHDP